MASTTFSESQDLGFSGLGVCFQGVREPGGLEHGDGEPLCTTVWMLVPFRSQKT